MDIDGMTVKQLQAELSARGLKKSGRKAELVRPRLNAWISCWINHVFLLNFSHWF